MAKATGRKAHELTHFIKDWSSVKYRAMADALVKHYQKQGVSVSELVDNQIAKAKQNGRELSRQEAFDEVVADSMETMLADENAAAFLEKLAQRDNGLKEKVVGWLKELAAKLKNAMTAYKDVKPDSPEGKIVAEMEDFRKDIMGIYTSALVDAGENFRENGGNKNTTREDGVKYQLREYSEQQKRNWSTSKRIVIYENQQQLSKFIRESIENNTMDKKMYFGAIPSDLAARIKADSGVDVENYNLSLGSYEVRKILKDHGNENVEAPRGQRAIVADDFAHIVDIVQNPRSISPSENTYMGKPAIVFSGEHNGRMNVVAVVSDKRLDLFVQTVYVNVKKGNLSTPIGEQAPINTPEASSGTVSSNKMVPQRDYDVKQKKSDRDPMAEATRAALEKENGKLREDVSRLRELLRLQGKVTGGTVPKQSSVEAAAKWLNKYAGAKADVKELSRMLTDFYSFLATDKDYSWEDVQQRAMVIARHLQDNVQLKPQISDYARDVLREVRGSKITLDESQRAEVEKLYGSYEAFRKAALGNVTFVKEGGIPLDIQWQEWSTMFPGTFDSEITASDQPRALMDAINALRNSDTTVMEYAYNRERN